MPLVRFSLAGPSDLDAARPPELRRSDAYMRTKQGPTQPNHSVGPESKVAGELGVIRALLAVSSWLGSQARGPIDPRPRGTLLGRTAQVP